jgi:antitoxin component of MazEF toxin-antitoxin module
MTTVFSAKVRKLGNSLAVIVPKKIAEEVGAKSGDKVRVSLLKAKAGAKSSLDEFAGIDSGTAKPFVRDRRDRV